MLSFVLAATNRSKAPPLPLCRRSGSTWLLSALQSIFVFKYSTRKVQGRLVLKMLDIRLQMYFLSVLLLQNQRAALLSDNHRFKYVIENSKYIKQA